MIIKVLFIQTKKKQSFVAQIKRQIIIVEISRTLLRDGNVSRKYAIRDIARQYNIMSSKLIII